MGKISQGILGGFSGAVGNVVGGSWKGIAYMRVKPSSITNPRTDLQVNQRLKFATVLRFLQPLTSVLRLGFRNYAIRMSAFNSAASYNYRNAVAGSFPDYSIDYANALVSRGQLTGAMNAVIASTSAGVVTLSWDDNSDQGNASVLDKCLAVVYNPQKGEVAYLIGESDRSATTQPIVVPETWVTDTVHGYLAFYSAEGNLVSNSSYAGSVTLTV